MPKIEVRIPTALRTWTGGKDQVVVQAATVRAAIETFHPHLVRSVIDERGALRPYVNLFLNSENVRDLAGLDSRIAEGDVLHIIPAIAGG